MDPRGARYQELSGATRRSAGRAWFAMNLQAESRPAHLAQFTMVMEAMRAGLQVSASHGGTATFHHRVPGDSFEVDGVRVLRTGLVF